MTALSTSVAIDLVRKNLDEIDPNGSIMYNSENGSSADFTENKSLELTIKRSLPEAINAVHLAAPVELLDWEDDDATPASVSVDSDTQKILTFTLAANYDFLRLVAFKATDSDIVVTNVIPQASVEGRKQANKYIRGQYDRPRLVREQGTASDAAVKFHYYSLKSAYSGLTPGVMIEFVRIIKKQEYDSSATSYNISYRVKQNIIDYLTALVLEVYSDQRAQVYYQKASIYPSI